LLFLIRQQRLDLLVAKTPTFNGEIIHFGAARLRVTGSGNLRCSLHSLDDVSNLTLPVIAMSAATDKEPVILANFNNQRGCFEFKTTAIDETFRIDKIMIFVKATASGYPQ
jgi:hypothetical protein